MILAFSDGNDHLPRSIQLVVERENNSSFALLPRGHTHLQLELDNNFLNAAARTTSCRTKTQGGRRRRGKKNDVLEAADAWETPVFLYQKKDQKVN